MSDDPSNAGLDQRGARAFTGTPQHFIGSVLDDESKLQREFGGASSLNAVNALQRGQSAPPLDHDEHADVDPNQMYRLTPDYYVYYYSQRPADPRLPTPLLSWSEYLRLAKVGHPTPQTVMMAQSAASRGDTDAQVFLLNMQASFQNMGMMPLSSYSEQLQQAYAQQQQQQQEMSAYLAANGLNAMGQQDQGLDDAEGLDVEDGEAEEGSALPGDATAGAGVGAGAGAALAGGANGKKGGMYGYDISQQLQGLSVSAGASSGTAPSMSPPGSASSNSKGLQAGQLNRGRSAGGSTAGAGVTAGRAGSPSTATATGAGGVGGVPFKGGVYNQSGAPALSPLLVLGQGKAGMPSRQQQQLMMMQQGGGNGAYGVFGNTGGELQADNGQVTGAGDNDAYEWTDGTVTGASITPGPGDAGSTSVLNTANGGVTGAGAATMGAGSVTNMAAMNMSGLGGMGGLGLAAVGGGLGSPTGTAAAANQQQQQQQGGGRGAGAQGMHRNARGARRGGHGQVGNRGLGVGGNMGMGMNMNRTNTGSGVWSAPNAAAGMYNDAEDGGFNGMNMNLTPAQVAAMNMQMLNMASMGNMPNLGNMMNMNQLGMQMPGMGMQGLNPMSAMQGMNPMGNMMLAGMGMGNMNMGAMLGMVNNPMLGMGMAGVRPGVNGFGGMGMGMNSNLSAALSPANTLGMTKSKMRDLGKTGGRRNQWLDEFRLNKGNSNLTLQHVIERNMVVELASDQYGSRFIQQKLETATVDEKNGAFAQIVPETLSLCTDVFGNYVIQKFFEYGTAEHRKQLIGKILNNVLLLSMQMYGCRVVQKAIDVADIQQQQQIVRELNGNVMQCVKDQNGNHVIQKCIEKIPPHMIQFIVEAFVNQIYNLSTHPYGCRVIQRLLEHCSEEQRNSILSEILDNTHELCKNQYGNYVIQHVLIHGTPWHKGAVIVSLRGTLLALSKHKFASNVIEKCFAHANRQDRMLLIEEVLGKDDDNNSPLLSMVKDQFANYVVQTMIDVVDDEQRELIVQRIRRHVPNLRKIPYGKHIIARIERLTGKPIVP